MTEGAFEHDSLFVMKELSKTRASSEKGQGFALRIPFIEIVAKRVYALTGASGSGKSTFLALAAMALRPDEGGEFLFSPGPKKIDVVDLWRRRAVDQMAALRSNHVGVVLQQGGLISSLTVRENILLPARLAGLNRTESLSFLVTRLGILDILKRRPAQISVGQRQRVAIARALINSPKLILADEPTASVDPLTADKIFELLVELVEETGAALIVASHDWRRVQRPGFIQMHQTVRADDQGVVSTMEVAA